MDDENGKLPAGYRYLREELRFEHTLLGSRMTYEMTSKSFLFTTAAIGRAVEWRGPDWFSGIMVPLVGIAASAVLLFSIHSANAQLDVWRVKEKLFEGKHPLIVSKQSRSLTTERPTSIAAPNAADFRRHATQYHSSVGHLPTPHRQSRVDRPRKVKKPQNCVIILDGAA